MFNKIRVIIIIFLIGIIFFSCKKNDYRDKLVGTYIMVCTQQQTYPFHPTIIYPIDTTDIGKEIEVTYNPLDELDKNGKGKVRISGNGGGIFTLSPRNYGYSFSTVAISHSQPVYNSGHFISPDSLTHVWDSAVNSSAEYQYRCSGLKVQ